MGDRDDLYTTRSPHSIDDAVRIPSCCGFVELVVVPTESFWLLPDRLERSLHYRCEPLGRFLTSMLIPLYRCLEFAQSGGV